MVREEIVSSAISFLQDPSVAASTLDKRIAFLQSKNLTQEEIDLALTRSGDVSQPQGLVSPKTSQSQYLYHGQQMRQPLGYEYGPSPYQSGSWTQMPLESPRRDWRDWFIMGTVTAGIGYGLYTVAKRYVYPLIAPPTPPQLEADKASIDASFERAFALIERLSSDTSDMKASENERTEKLDSALRNVDSLVEDLKVANNRHESENRIIANEVQSLKELVPRALEGWKASGDSKLEELGQELQSLRKLLENRVGKVSGNSGPAGRVSHEATANNQHKPGNDLVGLSAQDPAVTNTESTNGSSAPAPGVTAPKRGGFGIPAWQKAAAEKSGNATSTASGGESTAEYGA